MNTRHLIKLISILALCSLLVACRSATSPPAPSPATSDAATLGPPQGPVPAPPTSVSEALSAANTPVPLPTASAPPPPTHAPARATATSLIVKSNPPVASVLSLAVVHAGDGLGETEPCG